MIRLHKAGTTTPVWVNPRLIETLERGPAGASGSIVCFSSGHLRSFDEDAEQIVSLLAGVDLGPR